MKVVLTTAPRADWDLERAGLPFLGIGYIAAYLERFGHQVKITDPLNLIWDEETTIREILAFEPEAVGVTATTNNRFKAIKLIRELKRQRPSLFIFVGGPHFAMTAKNAMAVVPEIDCVVKGEGEITTKELLANLRNREKTAGIIFRDKDGQIIETPDRPFFHDINEFGRPAWHLYDIEKYRRRIDGTDIRAIGDISSRGCPNRCAFCVNAAFRGASLRLRDPKDFVDEVQFLKEKYGFAGFDFWDDTLTVSKDHVRAICDEILKRNLDIKWYARARANTVDKDILNTMAEAGCIRISYGGESGSPRILKLIKKGITPQQVINACQWASDAGMSIMVNFMVNLPEETREDLKMTVELMKRLRQIKKVENSYSFSIIYPGTEMETMAKEKGIFPNDFSWNEPYESEKYKLAGIDKSLPLMEWPGAEIERVKIFMSRELGLGKNPWKKVWRKLKKTKSWKDLKILIKAGLKFPFVR